MILFIIGFYIAVGILLLCGIALSILAVIAVIIGIGEMLLSNKKYLS